MKNLNASVVIATYNNRITLEKVLNAMISQKFSGKYEVIVVNDGSTDGTKDFLESFKKKANNIKVINQQNLGVCKARNNGIKLAKYEIIVNMDHDCVPKKNWLQKLVNGFDSEKVGVVSSYGYYGGTSTAFRKELLKKVGGYDEDYKYYREDTDLSFKIMDLGYEFKLVDAEYEHDHKEENPKSLQDTFKYVLKRLKYHQNDVLLYKKHPTEVCKKFLHIKFGFLVDPIQDFKVATGLWEKNGKFSLSSPRGITFLENKSLLHAFLIMFLGINYVFAVKFSRLLGSIRHGKLLL